MTGQSGYLGKRFLLKTDLATPLLDKGIGGEFEAVVFRNFSLCLNARTSNNRYAQYLEDYRLRYGEYPSELASIKDFQVGLHLKYFTSKAIPAPKGVYWFGGFSHGKANLVWNEYFHNNLFPDQEEYLVYGENGILTSNVDLGFGFQEIVAKFIVLDFSASVNYGTLHLASYKSSCTDCEFSPADFMGEYGPNSFVLSRRSSSNPGGIGISLKAQVGFLLF